MKPLERRGLVALGKRGGEGKGVSEKAPLELEVVISDGRLLPLSLSEQQRLWLGRSEDCAVVLPDPSVSRRHVSLQRRGHQLVVEDHSHNGSLVGGEVVKGETRTLSQLPVRLQLGSFSLRLRMRGTQNRHKPQAEVEASVKADAEAPRAAAVAPKIVKGEAAPVDAAAAAAPKIVKGEAAPVGAGVVIAPKIVKGEAAPVDAAARRDAAPVNAVNSAAVRPAAAPDVKAAKAALNVAAKPAQRRAPAACAHTAVNSGNDCAEARHRTRLDCGPLEGLRVEPEVTQIMVVDARTIFVERNGQVELTGLRFADDEAVLAVIQRLVMPLGVRVDASNPLLDLRLKDGWRMQAIIPPISLKGPCVSLRRLTQESLGISELIQSGAINTRMALFLERAVRVRKNIVIFGAAGSGKTTLLKVLAAAIPESERIATVEAVAELWLTQPHVIALEACRDQRSGGRETTLRSLLQHALKMRPNRVLVGQCTGSETLDLLQAMNAGHEGSMTTLQAESPRDAVTRLEMLCLGENAGPSAAYVPGSVGCLRAQIASGVHLLVQQIQFSDACRRIASITEVGGLDQNGEVLLHEIFRFECRGMGPQGQVLGEFRASGYRPSFVDQFVGEGLASPGACW